MIFLRHPTLSMLRRHATISKILLPLLKYVQFHSGRSLALHHCETMFDRFSAGFIWQMNLHVHLTQHRLTAIDVVIRRPCFAFGPTFRMKSRSHPGPKFAVLWPSGCHRIASRWATIFKFKPCTQTNDFCVASNVVDVAATCVLDRKNAFWCNENNGFVEIGMSADVGSRPRSRWHRCKIHF